MKIDVVIAVKNEASKLNICCTELLKRVPINNLIIVVGRSKDNTLETAKKYANIIVEDENKGIGYARSLGLEKVETDYYGSIDSDVIVSRSWYSWCIRTIKKPKVGACEGFLWPIGTNCQKVVSMWSKEWIKDYSTQIIDSENQGCSLGNTMLRTDIVREVGMPFERWGEDNALRKKLASKDYRWVVNYDLLDTHMISDIEVLLHLLHWSKFKKRDGNFFKELAGILVHFLDPRKDQDLNLSIYLLLMNLADSYRLLVKH
jgi:glycosyltransferase involved in cell wall biosynthesis